ncbi:MAG: DUF1257 domain-containing protein [Methanoregulaceae archaeon]
MSHFTKVATEFRNREVLVRCLSKMGYTLQEDGMVQGYRGVEKADFSIETGNGYGIGFRLNSRGTYDIVADWWGVEGTSDRNLLAKLKKEVGRIQQEYAERTVMDEVAHEGFRVVEKVEEEDGTVRILVRRWV